MSNNNSTSQSNPHSDEKPARLLFLGSGKVGKTALVRRFLQYGFDDKYQPTVEELYPRTFEVRGKLASIEIMDTSGSYDFPAMRQVWIKAASAFVLVFAQNDIYSFRNIQCIVQNIREERSNYDMLPIVVVCNKVDLPLTEKSFSDGTIEMWISEIGLTTNQFVYASAKTDSGVQDVFLKLWKQNEDHQLIPFPGDGSLPKPGQLRRRFSASSNADGLPSQNLGANNSSVSSTQTDSGKALSQPAAASPVHATCPSRGPLANPQKTSKGLLLNRFGSQKRQSMKVKDKKKAGRNEVAPIKLDCVIS